MESTTDDSDDDWQSRLPAWVRENRALDEAGWLDDFQIYFVLDYFEGEQVYRRKLRLFASACCRRVWNLLNINAARRIVELSEAFADDEIADAELHSAYHSPEFSDVDAMYSAPEFGIQQMDNTSHAEVSFSACVLDALNSARHLASPSGIDSGLIVQETSRNLSNDFVRTSRNYFIQRSPGRDEAEYFIKEQLLRDIFGNPFRTVVFASTWFTSSVVALARSMYTSRDFSAMPILADALQDAGCDNSNVLDHCCGSNIHVRGCWVVDLILGKS